MKTDLLLKLAKKLRSVPRKQFSMSVWVGDDWTGDPTLSCGTSACAMGWASTVPEIRKAGLRLVGPDAKGAIRYPWISIAFYDRQQRKCVSHSDYARIARKVFGLNSSQAYALFMPGWRWHVTPLSKAMEIEALVRTARKRSSKTKANR